MYTKYYNSTNEIDLGSFIRSTNDIRTEVMEDNEENLDMEYEAYNTKDFEVVRVDQGFKTDEDVEIIEVSCCPKIRLDSSINIKHHKCFGSKSNSPKPWHTLPRFPLRIPLRFPKTP